MQNPLDVHFLQSESLEPFDEMRCGMQEPQGDYGSAKMYRWARRISDWELHVCGDEEPQTNIKWGLGQVSYGHLYHYAVDRTRHAMGPEHF